MACPFEHFESYLLYKMIKFQNLSAKVQIKNFFFHRNSCFVPEILIFLYFHHCHDFPKSDVIMNVSTRGRVSEWKFSDSAPGYFVSKISSQDHNALKLL